MIEASVLDPVRLASLPWQLGGERGEEVVEGVSDDHVVVDGTEEGSDDHRPTYTLSKARSQSISCKHPHGNIRGHG